jgi:hypothetical protein
MLDFIEDMAYNRDVLIGRPRLTLKDFKCQNITCNKSDQFKKFNDEKYICECGYIAEIKEHEIEEKHKVSLYCKANKGCIYGKDKMNVACLKCELIGER